MNNMQRLVFTFFLDIFYNSYLIKRFDSHCWAKIKEVIKMATLTAQKRKEDNIGKKFAKQIRSKGQVPAVIYGQNQDPISISLDPVDFLKN